MSDRNRRITEPQVAGRDSMPDTLQKEVDANFKGRFRAGAE